MNKQVENKHRIKKILKIIGFSLLGIVTIFVIASIGVGVYFSNHKEKIVADINQKINGNIINIMVSGRGLIARLRNASTPMVNETTAPMTVQYHNICA